MGVPFILPASIDLPAAARARHMRRQLALAAEHGTAMLSALGLPRLVTPDFVPLDGAALGDAVDLVLASLDDIDGDADLEDDDREHDTSDAELSSGWTAKIDQVHLGQDQDDHETTALERHGRGFMRSGPDDAEDDDPVEDSDPAERDDHHGTEDDAFPWRREPTLVAFAAQVVHV